MHDARRNNGPLRVEKLTKHLTEKRARKSVYALPYSKRRRRRVQRVFFLNCCPVAGNIIQKMEPRERNEKKGVRPTFRSWNSPCLESLERLAAGRIHQQIHKRKQNSSLVGKTIPIHL